MDFIDKIKQSKINNRFVKNEFTNEVAELNVSEEDLIKEIYRMFKDKKFAISKLVKDNEIGINLGPRILGKYLENNNIAEKKNSAFTLTQDSIDKYILSGKSSKSKELKINTKSKNVETDIDKVISKKAVKYKVPRTSKGDAFDNFFREVYQNMKASIASSNSEKLLLKGKPGTGKTSSINQLATLFGMNLITIEGAHISEEDIINIPYVVAKGFSQEPGVASYIHNGSDFEVQNADSALVTLMNNTPIIREEEHLKMLNQNKLMKAIYNKYEKFIKSVRRSEDNKAGFKTILFIDEYFRTSDKKIQNLLRTILNGHIGNDDIPDNTYIIFASNMDNADGSLDNIALNQQFTNVNFDAPSANDFSNYIADKYTVFDPETGEEDESKKIRGSVKIQPEVYNAFVENISDSDLRDSSNEVPLSSRRMEQIILYVNSKIPLREQKDAKALMNFIDINLSNYQEGTKSELIPKYKNIVKSIIAETSPDINLEDLEPLPNTEWKNILSEQIDSKISIGKDRTYPVMLSGLPGTSKTFSVRQICKEKGLGLITIDASTLSIDSVNGLPVPETGVDGKIITQFTEPPLYKQIMSQYSAQYKDVYQEKRDYNFILFIDEFSRVESKQIQNKIRMLLLEHKVNSNYPIPDDIIIMGAMNPQDSAGSTTDLTNHTIDVIDIIPVELSILDVEKYLKGLYVTYKDEAKALGFDVQDISFNLIQKFYNRFKSNTNIDGEEVSNPLIQPFWWSIGDYLILYVSPREIADIFQGVISRIANNFEMDGWEDITELTEDILEEFIISAKKYAYSKYNGSLDFIADKQQIEKVDIDKFRKIINTSIMNSKYFDIIKHKKSSTVNNLSFSTLFKSVEYKLDDIIANEGNIIIEAWLNSLDDYTQASSDLGLLLNDVKTLGFDKLFYFLIDFIKFLDSINFSNIKGGTEDQLKKIFKNHIFGLTNDEMFITKMFDLPEADVDTLLQEIEKFKEL